MPMSGSILQLASRQLPLESITGSGLQIVGSLPQWGQAVDFSYPFNWLALHNFSQGLDSSGSLTFIGQQNIGTTGGANLILSPEGDLILDPTGNDVLPNLGYDINLGMLTKKYLTLHAAELWVETLVAQNTLATIGGRILVGPTSVLTSDMSSGDTDMYLKHNSFAINDVLFMQSNGKFEAMLIQNGPTGSGSPYLYEVSRNIDGTGINDWYAGDAVFSTGATGDGYIDIYSINGISASATTTGPTIVGMVRNNEIWNNVTEHWAIGNLNGLYGYGSTTYGVGLGKYASGVPHITIDSGSGIRFFSGLSTVMAQWDGLGNIIVGQNTAGQSNVYITSGCILLRNATTQRISIKSSGCMTINDSNGIPVLTFDASAGAEITKKLTMPGVNSAIAIGITPPTGQSTGTGIWIDRTGLYGMQNSILQSYMNGSGIIVAGGSSVTLSASGIDIQIAEAPGNDVSAITFLSGSTIRSSLRAYENGFSNYADLFVNPKSGAQSALNLGADGDVGLVTLAATTNSQTEGISLTLNSVAGTGTSYAQLTGGSLLIDDGDVYTVPFYDYGADSTVIGWSSTTTKRVQIKKLGKTVHVWFHLDGQSGSTASSFTVPYSTVASHTVDLVTRIRDNGGAYTTGLAEIFGSASKVSLYSTLSGGSWTSSGTKSAIGYFAYETS